MYKKVLLAAFAGCITGNLYSAETLPLLQKAYDQLAQEALTDPNKQRLLLRISVFPKVFAACSNHPPKNAHEAEGYRKIETEYHAALDEFFDFMIQNGHLKK